MAAALLRAGLEERSSPVTVASAGFVSEGSPPPPEVLDAMWALGLDLSQHRSRLVTPAILQSAALVIGMARQHVIDLAVLAPSTWQRSFTFADLLGRAETSGPRLPSEQVSQWADRLHAGRLRSGLLGLPLSEDIPDPMGRRLRDYQRTRDKLARMTTELADLMSPA